VATASPNPAPGTFSISVRPGTMIVASRPSARAAEAISQPMNPPPITAIRPLGLCWMAFWVCTASGSVRSTRTRGSWRGAPGRCRACDPVAMISPS
jgi:hypothetical protein